MTRRCISAIAVLLLLLSGRVATQSSGPSHHWTFDEVSGLQVLDSAGSVIGTLTDVARVPGVVGSGALHIQPWRASIVDFGPAIGQFGQADFTLSLWVRTNEPAFNDVIGNRTEGSAGNFVQVRLGIDGNGQDQTEVTISEDTNGVNIAVARGPSIRDSQWHLVTTRRQGTALSLFIDGQLAATAQSAGVTNIGVPGRAFHVGLSLADCCPGAHSAHMQVDDLRIWSRSLTDAEVAAQYFVPPVQPPLGDPLPPPPPPPCDPVDLSSLAPVRLVKDFNTICQSNVTLSSGAIPIGKASDRLLIKVGSQLWSTSGSEADPVLVKAFATSLGSVSAPLGARAVFAADDSGGTRLWITDGTTEGTSLLSGVPPLQLTSAGDRVFFTAITPAEGQELWVTDGTTEGTHLVKDIFPGSTTSTPANLIWAIGKLWFSAASVIDGVSQRELWTSDGTEGGTTLVANLNGTFSSTPSRATALGSRVLFYAAELAVGRELYASDGTAGGTGLVKDIRPGTGVSNSFGNLSIVAAGERVYFVANDGIAGNEVWTSDGTADGTRLVADLVPGIGQSIALTSTALAAFGGRLYFAATDGLAGTELWSTDGTTSGTAMVTDLAPGTASSNPIGFVSFGNRLFFRAITPGSGTELHVTDGTSDGTALVADLSPGAGSSNPTVPVVFRGSLFFGATHPAVGAELWVVDADVAPPTIDVSHVATGGWSSGLVQIVVSDPEDALSGPPTCTLDGIPATLSGGPGAYTLHVVEQGVHTVECTVIDLAMHTATDIDIVNVDSLAPTITVTHVADGADGTNVTSPVTVHIDIADEGGSPVGVPQCSVNAAPVAVNEGDGSYTLQIHNIGQHLVECTVSDQAGNHNSATDFVSLDTDFDHDGVGDTADPDDDGDGVADGEDVFPLDATETVDADGDGQGDNADPDDDNDGATDANDAFPFDAAEQTDTDGDGTGNNADADDDNDGVADAEDALPLDATETVDADGDGQGDNADPDDDNDGVADGADAFPLNAAEQVDTDGDGTGNNADTDDDGDSAADNADAFPLNAAEQVDTDGDGTGNNADTDDDNDGVADLADVFPLNASEHTDTDGDGTGNNADTDDDGDGTPDTSDAFPLNPAEQIDTDGDGTGNNTDTDDDNDGIPDVSDPFPTTGGFQATAQAAISSLSALLGPATGQQAQQLNGAITHLTAANDPALWEDATHLADNGQRVFNQHGLAVRALERVNPPLAAATAAITTILAIDRGLASTIIADATAAGGDAALVAQAIRAQARGDALVAAGREERAIAQYRRAWLLASRAEDQVPALFPSATELQATRSTLTALLPTGTQSDDRKLTRALDDIQNALDADLWVDDSHLTNRGERVFNQLSNALDELAAMSSGQQANLAGVMQALVGSAREVAETAVVDGRAAGGRDQALDRAEELLEQGDTDSDVLHGRNAIDFYRQAWSRAVDSTR